MTEQGLGASRSATGLAGSEEPEPHSRLGPTGGIPSAWRPIESAPREIEVLLFEPPSNRYSSLGLSHKRSDHAGGIYTGIADERGFWSYSFMGRKEECASLRWHVMVNGVGSWPVAWFYERDDAELWSRTMNETFASGIVAEGRDVEQARGDSPTSPASEGGTPK
jgi:hypothetical protein